jgi:hypothetical protein
LCRAPRFGLELVLLLEFELEENELAVEDLVEFDAEGSAVELVQVHLVVLVSVGALALGSLIQNPARLEMVAVDTLDLPR